MDDDGTTGEAGRWLSYAELAELRGITRKAAARLTLRHQWRRQPGNDGATRVWVPETEIPHRQPPRQGPPEALGDLDTDGPLTAANARADAAIALADRLLTQLTEAQTVVTSERSRADELRAALERACAEAARAVQALEERDRADAERKARGRWARLRAAWRGR
jgi:hypothetical protein